MYDLLMDPEGARIELEGLPLLTLTGDEGQCIARAYAQLRQSHPLRGKDFLHGLVIGVWYATRTGQSPAWALDLLPADLARETASWEDAHA